LISALAGILGTGAISYIAGELLGDHVLLRILPKFGGVAYGRIQERRRNAEREDLKQRLKDLEN